MGLEFEKKGKRPKEGVFIDGGLAGSDEGQKNATYQRRSLSEEVLYYAHKKSSNLEFTLVCVIF